MYTQKDIITLIKKFVSLASKEFEIESVYLFGSYAVGNANDYSDIDIAVVADNFEGSRFFDRRRLNEYILKTSYDLEVHPFKTEEFTEDNPFVKEILKVGLKLV